jgi:hypothetical protein
MVSGERERRGCRAVYNEEGNVGLCRADRSCLEAWALGDLFVDDGSTTAFYARRDPGGRRGRV